MSERHSNYDKTVHITTDNLSLFDLAFGAPEWMAEGLCAQTDPEAFFPEKGGSTREAKSVCSRCTVAAECLDYALEQGERFGIWGGLSERDRRRITRRTATQLDQESA
jgi:WhiB family transcriptional regulator, redox-sensing transcriptional regulator